MKMIKLNDKYIALMGDYDLKAYAFNACETKGHLHFLKPLWFFLSERDDVLSFLSLEVGSR